jgi:hypothetical protein
MSQRGGDFAIFEGRPFRGDPNRSTEPAMQNESISRVECCAATRPQQGHSQNEDAFLIGRGDRPFAALCDGAGNAERAAKRVLALFEKLLNEATPDQVTAAETWTKWIKLLDSSLLGAPQSTFLVVAFAANEAVGVCVGGFASVSPEPRGPVPHPGRVQAAARERCSAAVPHPPDARGGRHTALAE